MTVVVLAPLHDPVRVAEQLAALACIAPGRVRALIGAGYRREEFDMAGADRARRGSMVEELVDVCQQAFSGAPFRWRDRDVIVTPPPPVEGPPRLAVGGKSAVAAARAARLGCDFAPSSGDPEVRDAFLDESRRLGHSGRIVTVHTGFLMVSTDPERTWARIGRNALDDAHAYENWQHDRVHSDGVVFGAEGVDDLRASGKWQVLTPDECIAAANRTGVLSLHPLMGGLEPSLAWESLSLIESEVLPAIGISPTPGPLDQT